ncbi:MAG: hypothetical protein E3J92_01640 [Dehalococcoidia bacterium]|nr:MAG: hypothetical protein E3J92_01640 [Dehalococcoidia bacterium]
MAEKPKRKRGAPKGNQNARKHGFYSKVLDEAEQLDFELAAGVEGFDDEIALLRVKIKSLLENDPENIKLLMDATNTLVRLVKTKYKITKEQKQGLKEAIENVLKDIAIPLGLGIGQIVTK